VLLIDQYMSRTLKTTVGNYFRQLDALRAIAVSMVIFSHWAGYHENAWTDDVFWFNGEVGVQLFFIISGFLISGILLDERERAEIEEYPKTGVLKAFYVRRFLRIFPLFYATLFVTFVLGHPDVRASIKWHALYLSNFFFARRGDYLGDVSHFWSLAVEEQFYLVWPFFILFLPKRILVPFVITVILLAPVFRYLAAFAWNINDVAVNVLPISSLDSLGIGSLMALIQRLKLEPSKTQSLNRCFLFTSFFFMLTYFALHVFVPIPQESQEIGFYLSRSLLVPGLACFVLLCAQGIRGLLGKFFEFSPLSYLGKISYGLYIMHFFIPGTTAWLCNRFGYPIWERLGVGAYLALNLIVLVGLSSLSWYFFESRINEWKRYFPYVASDQTTQNKFSRLFTPNLWFTFRK
jgi:peptidoglycan/LPS O-acetylase OafA/YrhL